MKKIKWILLAILVIVLVITGILFANFLKNREEVINGDNKIEELYDIRLYRKAHNIYENGELLLDFTVVGNGGYIIFDEKQIIYCETGDICNSSNYTYDNENSTIYVESYNKFLDKGTYNIVIVEDIVELSIEKGFRKTVYYLDIPKG